MFIYAGCGGIIVKYKTLLSKFLCVYVRTTTYLRYKAVGINDLLCFDFMDPSLVKS